MRVLGRGHERRGPPERGLQRRAAVASAAVAAAGLLVFTIVVVVAPKAAHRPPADFSPSLLNPAAVSGTPYASAQTGLSTASPSNSPFFIPSPAGADVARDDPTASPVKPAYIVASMHVSARKVQTGDSLIYRVELTNRGGRAFTGAFTINQHTPAGTARCVDVDTNSACLVPGDYSGDSQNPNDPHANPSGVTRIITIPPGKTVVATAERVVVSGVAGTTLHNHAHVDGVGVGNSSATTDAADVNSRGLNLGRTTPAPEVYVTG